MIKISTLKNSAIFSLAGILPLLPGFILLPFYTNLLSPDLNGQFSIYLGMTLVAQILISFGFDSAIHVFYHEYKNNYLLLSTYINKSIKIVLLIGIIFIFITFLGGYVFLDILHFSIPIKHFKLYSLICISTAICTSVLKIYGNLLIQKVKAWKYLITNLLNFLLSILFSIIGLYIFSNSILGPLLGRLFAFGISFIVMTVSIKKEYNEYSKDYAISDTFSFNYPVVLNNLLTWLFQNADRYVILIFLTTVSVAIYDISLKMALLIEFISTAIFLTFNSKLYSIYSQPKETREIKELSKIYHSLTAVQILLIGLNIFFIPLLIPYFITNKDYSISFEIFPLIGLSYALNFFPNMYVNPLVFFKKTSVIPIIYSICFITKIGLCWVLIQKFQLYGAVFALILNRPIECFIYYLIGKSYFSFPYNPFKMFVLPFIYVLISLALYYAFKSYNSPNFTNFLIMIISFSLVFLTFSKEIKPLLHYYYIEFNKKIKKNIG